MIKNIVLDMGNVLLDYNPERILDLFCDYEEARSIITRELFKGPEWIMADRGEIRETDKYDLVKVRIDEKYHESLRKCIEGWPETMVPVDGALDFIKYIKSKGYKVYLLSNAPDNFDDYFETYIKKSLFDGIIVSAFVKTRKPDKEIYDILLNTYSLKAEECLFIDDRDDNVDAARAAGLNARKFSDDFDVIIKEWNI